MADMQRLIIKPIDYSIREDDVQHFMSISDQGDFIPIQCLTTGDVMKNSAGRKVMIYELTVPYLGLYGCRQIKQFTTRVIRDNWGMYNNRWNKLYYRTLQRGYLGTYGTIVHTKDDSHTEVEPLMLLCLKEKYLSQIRKGVTPPDSWFALVINTAFIQNEEHFKLYRNLKKNFLDELQPELDIVYTGDIMGRCFSTGPEEKQEYASVKELMESMSKANQLLVNAITNE